MCREKNIDLKNPSRIKSMTITKEESDFKISKTGGGKRSSTYKRFPTGHNERERVVPTSEPTRVVSKRGETSFRRFLEQIRECRKGTVRRGHNHGLGTQTVASPFGKGEADKLLFQRNLRLGRQEACKSETFNVEKWKKKKTLNGGKKRWGVYEHAHN